MEAAIQHPESIRALLVSLENLDGHNQRVLHQVAVHHAVENVNSSFIAARRKQRIRLVEINSANGESVIPQRLVRFDGKIQVEPAQPSVKAAQDNIVPLRVHRLRPEATTASHLKSTAWSLAQAC
eukprot:m.868392 g.868392  ORF g.868392 m.868392 type:complete len:125 (+) comp23562_c0_seq5:287-661(+)